jgi:crotonobetainyl-CoA:carnitine CoA-transferase CaiB-like acyl-CoA transferase
LSGIRVVDLSVGMASALIAKYLADSGAQVVRVEPEGGDPFYGCYPAYEVWRRGSILNREARRDPSKLRDLLATADVCIQGGEDHPDLKRRDDAQAIAAANPRIVVLDIASHPPGSRDAGRPLNELLAQARSGLCYEQSDARPIFMGYRPANYGATLQGLCALLGALYAREVNGRGQIVRTSLFEGALTWLGLLWGDFERASPQCFLTPKDTTPLIFRCADGAYIHFVIGAPGSKYQTYRILGIEDPSVQPGDSGMPDFSSGTRNFFGDVDLLASHIAKRNSGELLDAMWNAGLPAERVSDPGACWDSPQSVHNGLVLRDPDGTRHVGNPIKAKKSAAAHPPSGCDSMQPLGGVRIIDFGAYLSGPKASSVLADLGADVIKVEPPNGDPNRGSFRSFIAANRGKRAIVLDLKTTDGLRIAHDLSAKADIVCNNFRSAAAARLGIDAGSLHGLNPGLIVLESPAYGSSGPMAERAGFDMVMQAVCGHEIRAGGEGNEPLWNRTVMCDFAGGMLGAIGLLSALLYRARTGNGVALDVSLFNAGVFLLSELVQRPDGSFEGAEPINGSRTGLHPAEALYEAKDGWLAISVQNENATEGLSRILRLEGKLSTDAKAWGASEAGAIAGAVAQRPVAELSAALESAGVWTEVCRTQMEREILNSQCARITSHRTLGRIREIGPLFRFSESRIGNDLAIPDLGEHTRQVLAEQRS